MTASPYDSACPPSAVTSMTWARGWPSGRPAPSRTRTSAAAPRDAVDAIDAALGELYWVRARLVAEIRQSDAAAAARADELLRRRGDPITSLGSYRSPRPKRTGPRPGAVSDMTADPADQARRGMIATGQPAADLAADEGRRWTDELRAEFEVLGFAAPFVVVRRRSDGQLGTLEFTHHPRVYFGWRPDDE